MLIRLEHKGVHLFEIDAAKIDKDIDIGRSSECAWRVPSDDKDVSSRHARLSCKGNVVWIEDLGSSNGTFLRLTAPAFVDNGDQFLIGRQLVRVELQ